MTHNVSPFSVRSSSAWSKSNVEGLMSQSTGRSPAFSTAAGTEEQV